MQLTLTWHVIALRLAFALAAGILVGLNRGEHGQPAGLRTNIMVCLAATIAMILANLLLNTTGKQPNSFVTFDVMRLPLGILTGMGFIGAGAVMRRREAVTGITTAATLWLVTVIGLCFGSGQIILGTTSTILALAVLEGLRWIDRSLTQDRHAVLVLMLEDNGPTPDELNTLLTKTGFSIATCAVTYSQRTKRRRLACEIRWHGRPTDFKPPEFLEMLLKHPSVLKLQWKP
jgi:putative Mg2+ transporter-C (MgtC) family protein